MHIFRTGRFCGLKQTHGERDYVIHLCVTDKSSINIRANDRKTRTNKLVKPHVVLLSSNSSWSAILRGESEWAGRCGGGTSLANALWTKYDLAVVQLF